MALALNLRLSSLAALGGASGPAVIPGVLAAGMGTFNLSGVDMTPLVDTVFTADFGAFPFTGLDAGFLVNRVVAANLGTFALTGVDAALVDQPVGAYTLTAGAGTFALTGIAVTLTDTPPSTKGVFYNNGFASNNTAQTTYTFTGVPLGTADPNRVAVFALGIRSTAVISISSVTLDDGSGARSMTETIGKNIASTAYTGLWQLGSTSGATGTVVVTITNAAVRACIDSFSVVTATPTASATASSAANNPTASLTNPASAAGAIVASLVSLNATDNNATPTGYTEDKDTHISTSTTDFTCGHDNTPASGAKTYTITWGGTPIGPNGVFATWAQ